MRLTFWIEKQQNSNDITVYTTCQTLIVWSFTCLMFRKVVATKDLQFRLNMFAEQKAVFKKKETDNHQGS